MNKSKTIKAAGPIASFQSRLKQFSRIEGASCIRVTMLDKQLNKTMTLKFNLQESDGMEMSDYYLGQQLMQLITNHYQERIDTLKQQIEAL